MKQTLLLILLAGLTACSAARTPEDRYFVLTGAVTATGRVVQGYVDGCHALEATDPCHRKLPKIHAAAESLKTALAEADKVFVTHDSAYYDLSLSVAQNALANLQTLLKESPNE